MNIIYKNLNCELKSSNPFHYINSKTRYDSL